MMKRLFKLGAVWLFLLALVAVPLISSCCHKHPEPRLSIGITSDPKTIVPMKAEHLTQVSMLGLIYEPLVLKIEDGSVEPWLASSWDVSANKLEYTFHINPKAKFSDGNAVSAADVKYSFDVGKRHHAQDGFVQTKPAWAQIDTITAVDTNTVKFTLYDTYGAFLSTISRVFIVPQAIWEDLENPDDPTVLYNYEPPEAERKDILVGSGPFTFEQYVADQWFWVVKNNDYWRTEAKIDDVVFKIYVTSDEATIALKVGEVDALAMVDSPAGVASILQTNDYAIELDILSEFNHSTMLYLNLRYAPFNILEVRQAISKAIDRQSVIDTVVRGYAHLPQNVPYAPGLPLSNSAVGWNDEGKIHTTLVAEANALLDSIDGMSDKPADLPTDWTRTYDKGDGNGPQEMSYDIVYVASNDAYAAAFDLIKENLMEIGISVTANPVKTKTYSYALFSQYGVWDWEMALFGYASEPDFVQFVREWGCPVYCGDSVTIGWRHDSDREPGDGLTVHGQESGNTRPTTFDTPNWSEATEEEKAHYQAVYNQLVSDSSQLTADLQATILTTDTDDYKDAVVAAQALFEQKLPVITLYHEYYLSAYRTDRFTGWDDMEAVYYYSFVPPTVSVKTLMALELK